jgi:hypothetical protein
MIHTLSQWERGVPVQCGNPWTREAIKLAVTRGPHPTARLEDAIALVHEDVAYQVTAGFSTVVLWDDIKDHLHPNFKISPVAVVPQTGRRGRIILDLSFPLRRPQSTKRRRGRPQSADIVQESVNDSTVKLAPEAAVKAIGQVLPRLFQFMAETPADEMIGFSKIDLSDGFWRMIVEDGQHPPSKWDGQRAPRTFARRPKSAETSLSTWWPANGSSLHTHSKSTSSRPRWND